tara:strand:- start:1257 stop:1652 length:396 start_codon:yes stop_codon:yes gene_type:complete
MSEVLVNKLTGTSTAGSILVTGEGNSTTTNLQQGLAKTWVNIDGTGTIAARDSLNVGSLTDNGTGTYDINFTNNFGNINYCMVVGGFGGSGIGSNYDISTNTTAESNVRGFAGTAYSDADTLQCAALGDLA